MRVPVRTFLKYAFTRTCVIRSAKVALVVGTLLGIINHFDGLIAWRFTGTDIFQILLTYLVPYAVSTYGSAMQACYMESQTPMNKGDMEKG